MDCMFIINLLQYFYNLYTDKNTLTLRLSDFKKSKHNRNDVLIVTRLDN